MTKIEKTYQALSEVYPGEPPEEIHRRYVRGRYKFYPDKTLRDLCYEFAGKGCYKYDSADQIIDYLCRFGYEETSTGVIQLLESC